MKLSAAKSISRFSNVAALATLLAGLSLGCAPHYIASNFDLYSTRTKVVAIAPMANLSTDKEGAQAGQSIREAIFYELSRRQDKYTVSIQDIAETDKRIREASSSDSAAARLPGVDLCKMIGADAVMKGSVTRFRKKGAGGQVATLLLFGFAKGSEIKADVAIYDGTDGKLIWQHNIEKAGGLMSSPDALRNKVGGAVAKKFPYKKKT